MVVRAVLQHLGVPMADEIRHQAPGHVLDDQPEVAFNQGTRRVRRRGTGETRHTQAVVAFGFPGAVPEEPRRPPGAHPGAQLRLGPTGVPGQEQVGIPGHRAQQFVAAELRAVGDFLEVDPGSAIGRDEQVERAAAEVADQADLPEDVRAALGRAGLVVRPDAVGESQRAPETPRAALGHLP